MRKKPVQYFSKEYLERSSKLTPDQIVEFLEDFQKMMSETSEKCQLISLKVEPSLLRAFKMKSKLSGVAYQTKIKQLMKDWLAKG